MTTIFVGPVAHIASTTVTISRDNFRWQNIHFENLYIIPLENLRLSLHILNHEFDVISDSGLLPDLAPPLPFYFAIFLRGGVYPSSFIGYAGIRPFKAQEVQDGNTHCACGWPIFEFKFFRESIEIATEFAAGFFNWWWSLPREVLYFWVDSSTFPEDEFTADISGVVEILFCCTFTDNLPGARILEAIGFESFEGMDNGMVNWRLRTPRE